MSETYDYLRLPSNGREFELYVAAVFQDLGYHVEVTRSSGDFGADVILTEPSSGFVTAVQAKFYNGAKLGNGPVQEVAGSLAHYGADCGWVVTNGTFSANAQLLARENGVRLIDGAELNTLVSQACKMRSMKRGSAADVQADFDASGLDVLDEEAVAAAEVAAGYAAPATLPYADAAQASWQPAQAAVPYVSDVSAAQRPTHTMPMPRVADASGTQGAQAVSSEVRYTMSDLACMWGVSTGEIKHLIGKGMPMYKMPNGRWEIGAGELEAWTDAYNARHRRRRIARIVVRLVVLALVVIGICVAVNMLRRAVPDNIEGISGYASYLMDKILNFVRAHL